MPREFSLGRQRMLRFLDGLGAAGGRGQTLYLPKNTPSSNLLEKVVGDPPVSGEITDLTHKSTTGVVLFWGESGRYVVQPPFPITEADLSPGYQVAPLRSMLERDWTIALILVRLGAYAIGVTSGDKLMAARAGTGLVHGRHRQGGSSQHRFERHREKQIEYFLTRVCAHAREQLQPHLKIIDFLVYGGAWTTIDLLMKQCPFLGRIDAPTLPPLLTIPDPRRGVLERAVEQVWSSKILEYGALLNTHEYRT